MAKYKVLKNNVFGEGYLQGDVIEREPHAMENHINKGEVEEIKEEVIVLEKPIDVVNKAIKEIKEEKKEEKKDAIVCDKCNKEFKSKGGLTVHKRTCKKK